jgi:hypothetical protein
VDVIGGERVGIRDERVQLFGVAGHLVDMRLDVVTGHARQD